MTAKAIDRYIESRSAESLSEKIDPRLQDIVEGIFKRCIEDGEHKQVRGS
jgi:26S proteasome regulatory subunit N2